MSLRIPQTTPPITLERVTLRAFHEGDVEGRRLLGRDPEIQRAFGGSPNFDTWQPMSEDAARAWYQQQLRYEGPFVWALDVEGRLIGGCRLHSVEVADERARYAVGILDPELLGRGLGTEITKGVLDYAFDEVGFHRIDLRVLASNKRAVACYAKCGFEIEGRERESARIGDEWQDDLLMGVLGSDWREVAE